MEILVAAKDQRAAETLSRFLEGSGCEIRTATDGMTIRAIDLSRFGAVFLSVPLAGETGIELLSEIREHTNAHLFVLVKEELAEAVKKKTAPTGAYVITKPLFKGALTQALRFCELNLEHEAALRAQTEELKRRLEEQKTVSRAKILLVERGMTEEAAHRHIQQAAMNRRMTQKEVAEDIIREAEDQRQP